MNSHDGEWGVAQEAALWVIRLQSDDSEACRREFDAWARQSREHVKEFLLAMITWKQLDVLKPTAPMHHPVVAQTRPAQPCSHQLPRKVFRAGASLGLAAGLVILALSTPLLYSRVSAIIPEHNSACGLSSLLVGCSYATRFGEVHKLYLEDGSKLDLNSSSQVRVFFTKTERRVELSRGEAIFDIASDPARPFLVKVGNTTIRDKGTRFSVRREAHGKRDAVEIVVAEGSVVVNDRAPREFGAGSAVTVHENQVEVSDLAPNEVANRLSWTSGYLQFGEVTLGDAVRQINRYNSRQLAVADSSRDIRIGGRFKMDEVDRFLKGMERIGIQHRRVTRPDGTEETVLYAPPAGERN